MSAIIDASRHPYDSASLVNWALAQWEEDPTQGLMILTEAGKGPTLANRFNYTLSQTRSMLRKRKHKLKEEFGVTPRYIRWTDTLGGHREALCLERFVNLKHQLRMRFRNIDLTQLESNQV